MTSLTYKYLIKGKRASRQLRRSAWAVNQVWNYCGQTQRSVQRAWRDGLSPRWPSHFDLARLAAGTSRDLGIHGQTIQCVAAQFARSRDQHRKCPRYRHSGGPRRSLGWVPFQAQSRQIDGNAITYYGNTYRFFASRPLPPVVRGGCFVEDARGRWWACLHVEVADDLPQAPDVTVGIDLGLETLATLSTGTKYAAPRFYRLWEDKLGIAQLANDQDRVRSINAKIKNCRHDNTHKWTTEVTRSFRTIYVGDVSSSRLARTRMAKSIYDAGWAASKYALSYKASRRRGMCTEVDEQRSTQICSHCGVLPPERPRGIADLGMREWGCSSCGTHHDRDVNAARNILATGLSAQPPAEESRVAHGR
jgi:putative transposase